MSDITKCGDRKCPSREHCRRYTAPGGEKQSYADFNRPEEAEQCEDFILDEKSLVVDADVLEK